MKQSPSRSEPVVETFDLAKAFGGKRVLDSVDLVIPRGSVYGLLGPNGAGKTTMIRILATLLRPDAARRACFGHDVVREADAVRERDEPDRPVRLGRRGPDRGVRTWCCSPGCWAFPGAVPRREPRELLGAFGLADAAGRQVEQFSGGMRRRLDIAASLIVTPEPALPRRANHRPRPAKPQPGVGDRPGNRRRGHHGAADDPVSRRGRPARGPDRGHRRRAGDRRGHARRAQGVGRRGQHAGSTARPGTARRGRAHAVAAGSAPPCTGRRDPASLIARIPSDAADEDVARTGGAGARRALARRGSGSAISPSASRAWTRCSLRSPAAEQTPRTLRQTTSPRGRRHEPDPTAPAEAPAGRGSVWALRSPSPGDRC